MAQVLNIAHRGASAYAYENTADAIDQAVELGAEMVEFDLRRTADGVIVLWHDDKVRARSGKWIPVSKASFDDLHFFAKNNEFRPAKFIDVLKGFGSRIPFNIEIKEPGFEAEVLSLLDRFPPIFAPVISSYHSNVIRKIKKIKRSIKTGIVVGRNMLLNAGAPGKFILRRMVEKSGADSARLNLSIASKKNITELIKIRKPVSVWTVNDEDDMKRLIDIGVHGIITDRPDILNKVRGGFAEPALRFSEDSQFEKTDLINK